MAFRADEAARLGFEHAEAYLVPSPRDVSEPTRARAKEVLLDLVDELGPVVDAYPSWHPLVTHHDSRTPVTTPTDRCGYQGLDHTICFANGFVTCPYGDGQEVIDSVATLPHSSIAEITAERLDVSFYNEAATSILVRCNWQRPLEAGGLIPLALAVPLILEKEVPCWHWSEVAETWETMRPYLIGRPHGSRSSLFVSQETGQAIKKLWNALIYTGMFGPIKV